MNKQNGIVANWNEDKGFGFIDPQAGNRKIFAHISDYSKGHQKPFKGLEVQYLLSTDQRGRKRAVEVSPVTGYSKYSRGVQQKLFSFVLLIAFSGALFFLLHSQRIPLEVVYVYAIMSVFTFLIYAKDKHAAKRGAWRTSESKLHMFSLLGGWPGAAIGQSFLRHKSKKLSFRITYWVTVIVNCTALCWLLTGEGRILLNNVMRSINLA